MVLNTYRSQVKHLLQSIKLNGLAVAAICPVNRGLFLHSEHRSLLLSAMHSPVNLACSPASTGKVKTTSEALHYSSGRQLFKTMSKKHFGRQANVLVWRAKPKQTKTSFVWSRIVDEIWASVVAATDCTERNFFPNDRKGIEELEHLISQVYIPK